jgi:hypothetical protein
MGMCEARDIILSMSSFASFSSEEARLGNALNHLDNKIEVYVDEGFRN